MDRNDGGRIVPRSEGGTAAAQQVEQRQAKAERRRMRHAHDDYMRVVRAQERRQAEQVRKSEKPKQRKINRSVTWNQTSAQSNARRWARTPVTSGRASVKAGACAFVVSFIFLAGHLTASSEASVVGACISAVVFAKFYRQILQLAAAVILIMLIARSQHQQETTDSGTSNLMQADSEIELPQPSAIFRTTNARPFEAEPAYYEEAQAGDHSAIGQHVESTVSQVSRSSLADLSRGAPRTGHDDGETQLTIEQRRERNVDSARGAFPQSPYYGRKLFRSPADLSIHAQADVNTAYILHEKPVPYASISHFVFHERDHWGAVVMIDGTRMDLGVPIGWSIRPCFIKAKTINLVRMKNRESVDGAWRPIVKVHGEDRGYRFRIGAGIESVTANDRSVIKITSIAPGSPAAKAELLADDLILAVDGDELTRNAQLIQAVQGSHGESILLDVARDGVRLTVRVVPLRV